MLIKFDEMDWKANPNFKGGEKTFFNKPVVDEYGKIMMGRLEPGASIGFHGHDGEAEIVYILSGHGAELYDDGRLEVHPGECHYLEDGHSHSLINTSETEDLVFFSVIPKH